VHDTRRPAPIDLRTFTRTAKPSLLVLDLQDF